MRVKCKKCSKVIRGLIKVDTYRQRLGAKSLNRVNYYDTKCFKTLNKERSMHEYKEKARAGKRRSSR